MTINLKENLRLHLEELVRKRDPYLASGGYFYVKQYLRTELEKWGTVEIDQFRFRHQNHQNIILHLPALNPKLKGREPLILIGAHYDTVPGTPGADDNASGVAVLLELARTIATHPLKYPVQLVAFDMEEYGLLGSEHYARKLKQQKQEIRLMISLEMLGYCHKKSGSQLYPKGLEYFYPTRGDFIALIGNLRTVFDMIKLRGMFRKAGSPCEFLPVPLQGRFVPDTRRSDHVPFWDLGYSAIMITDTANLRNPHYHKPSDTIDTLDLDFITHVCQGLINGLHDLF
jgi:Zn-dependent M28 family amino/carboxypeptidase